MANRARLDSVFNTDILMAEQPEKKEGKVDVLKDDNEKRFFVANQ